MHAKGAPESDDALAQTIASMNQAPVSQGTYTDLAYPQTLTRRIADRILRESFEDHFRMVPAMRRMREADSASLVRDRVPRHPPLRGAGRDDVDVKPEHAACACEIGALLATKGVLHAACVALREQPVPADRAAELLRRVGVPVDLLAHVLGQPRDRAGVASAGALVRAACAATASVEQARDSLIAAHATKPWSPTVPGATLRSDAGDAPHAAAMIAVARDDYLFAPGDGGALDHARACAHALTPTPIIALARDPDRAAAILDAPHVRLVPCDQAPAQFIRDAVAVLEGPSGSTLLIPRFPSRGEVGTPFAADLLPTTLDALSQALRGVNSPVNAVHSPLHFHGGDILCWHDRDGAHVLIGEGTVARNTAMGLTQSQAKDAVMRELNAVELVVLPATTFHIDTCLSLVATRAGPTFLLADPIAAARLIIDESVERLRKAHALTPANARAISGALARHSAPAASIAFGLINTHVLVPMSDPGSPPLAALLAPTDPDGGVASTLRFLHAVDLIAAWADSALVPPHVRAYLDSLGRTSDDLALVREAIASRGHVRHFPASMTGARAAVTTNMVHLSSGATLLPEFGGVCVRLDAACRRVLESELGRRAIPIPSSESGLRLGAVRCSLVVLG